MNIKYFLYFLYFLIAPLLILAILILYKFNIIIRLVPLITDRIGHFATNSAIYYFSKENLNIKSNFKFIDFVYFQKEISNNFLAHKIKNKLKYEKMFRHDSSYDLLIPIEYNTIKPKKNRGSAIFLHLTKNYKKTLGCVAIKKKDMLILIKLINNKTKIRIS